MGQAIALVGIMGCGKTTVGQELAKLLDNYSLLETDEKIEQSQKMSINDIFAQKGEEYFRTLETELLKKYSYKENLIISTGGGMFLREENRKLLENTFTVYLYAPVKIIFERIKNDTSRPLLNCANPEEKLSDLLYKREEYYKLANTKINTENKLPKQIAHEILEKYKNYEQQNRTQSQNK